MTSKRICVLGAGGAGLCAARHSMDAGHNVTVFEQQSDVGGTWLYSPKLDSFSSLYENLVTNLPKEIMIYEHLKFETDGKESFVGHEEMLKYLRKYAEPVRKLIQFNTRVVAIKRVGSEWQVSVKPAQTIDKVPETFTFDVLFICNGHYSEPRIPSYVNKLKIPWIHAHNYRRPQEYKDKEVVIVGGNPSGFDIATHLSKYAKKIHLLHNQRFTYVLPDNICYNEKLQDVSDDGKTLLLENGEEINSADAVIFCNGYRLTVPFFEKELLESKENESYLSPLYQHMVHCEYPDSLFVIGMPWFCIHFICFDLQVHYALSLIDGTSPIPPKSELYQFEADRLATLKERDLPARYFHGLAKTDQWEYFDALSELTNRPKVPTVVRNIYNDTIMNMRTHTATYKNVTYRIKNDEEFELSPLEEVDCIV